MAVLIVPRKDEGLVTNLSGMDVRSGLGFFDTRVRIAAIVLVQLNYAIAPRAWWRRAGSEQAAGCVAGRCFARLTLILHF